jgi:hypothetical protein
MIIAGYIGLALILQPPKITIMKKSLLTLLFGTMMTVVIAQTKDAGDGQELIKQFFDLYKTKGYEAAVKYAWSTNSWIPASPDDMNTIILNLGKQVNQMGEFIGQEELRSKKAGSRFRIVSYLVYYQRDPIRFTFELYRNNNGWEITDFVFDTRFEEELEESIKLTSGYEQFR